MAIRNATRPGQRPMCGDDLRTWCVIAKGEVVTCTSKQAALALAARHGGSAYSATIRLRERQAAR